MCAWLCAVFLLFQDTSLGRGTQNSLSLVPPGAGITSNNHNIYDLGYQDCYLFGFFFLTVDNNLSFSGLCQ